MKRSFSPFTPLALFAALSAAACGNSSSNGPDTDTSNSEGNSTRNSDSGAESSSSDPEEAPTLALGIDESDLPDPDAPGDEYPVPGGGGLAPTPPMGWNSWNKFGCNVSSDLIKEIADAMVDSGMKDVGYQYVNIDDCWMQKDRDENDLMQPTDEFPGGIPEVAEYVHSLGLKLGVYSDRGTGTCQSRAGSEGFEVLDAQSYADWGVDYLKYDNCNANDDLIEEQYGLMGEALASSGRDIVYSICAWRFYEWGVGMGHLWRVSGDIKDEWSSIMENVSKNVRLGAYAGANAWNDPDMLEVGNGGMTTEEYRSHMSLWAIMAAPLIAGNDLRDMDDETVELLTNEEVLAVNQDSWGLQAGPVWSEGSLSVWAKPLNEEGARAVLLFNEGDEAEEITANFGVIGLRKSEATVRDLWQGKDLGTFDESYSAQVPARGVKLLKIVGDEPHIPAGEAKLSNYQWVFAANGLGPVERNMNVGATKPGDGDTLSIRGQEYDTGFGVSAPSALIFRVGANCSEFRADIGIDDIAAGKGSVVFQIFGDGEELFTSDLLTGDDDASSVKVDIEGVKHLKLLVTNGLDGNPWDRADWANARVSCND